MCVGLIMNVLFFFLEKCCLRSLASWGNCHVFGKNLYSLVNSLAMRFRCLARWFLRESC